MRVLTVLLFMYFLEKHPLDYWDEERMKNAVAEEMPEYPAPKNFDVSPPSLPDDDQRDGEKSTALDGEQDSKETLGETNRYSYIYTN